MNKAIDQEIDIQRGQFITIYKINAMAMTSQHDCLVHEAIVDENKNLIIVYKDASKPRSRKYYGITIDPSVHLVLNGKDTVLGSDMKHSNCMTGNACINLVNLQNLPMQEVRQYIEEAMIIPCDDSIKGRILVLDKEQASNAEFNPTRENIPFPEIDVHCGPLNDAKKRV